jgi:hypothetical protein
MKAIILFVLVFSGLGFMAKAQSGDFRSFAWGSSLEQVQAAEKASFYYKLKNYELEYEDQLAGSDCNVIYIFNANNKLVSGNYFFTKKYSNPQIYVHEYNKFKALLTEKYGKPTSDKESWSTHVSGGEKHNFGQAVADGNLSLNTVWTSNHTQIKIALITSDKNPSLQIQYTSLSSEDMENKDDLKKALIKL